MSFEKKNTAEVSINFHDGTNTELVWFGDMTDASVFFSANLGSRWQGWKDAHIDIVVANAGLDGSIGIGYVKVGQDGTLDYDTWNSLR